MSRVDDNEPDLSSDEGMLAHIRTTYDYYTRAWRDIYEQGDRCMVALSTLGPWPERERAARVGDPDNPRPCEHFDIISQQNNRVVNQARMNKRAIKVTPRGSGANDKTAELREMRIRQIQYESKADRARLTAFQNAVDRGYGFWEIDTEFIDPLTSPNLKIVYRRIPNPSSVLLDPDAMEADFSDAAEGFKITRYSHAAYRRAWPDAEIKSFTKDLMNIAPLWIDEKSVMVATHYMVEKTKVRMVLIEGEEQAMAVDELQKRVPGIKLRKAELVLNGNVVGGIKRQWEAVRSKVVKRITNGVEILETVPWLGSTIPLIACIGREKYVNGIRDIESLTLKQIAPQLAFDYARTGSLEALGNVSKTKWVIADGQLEGFDEEWKYANRSTFAYLRYNAVTDATGHHLLPPPQRIDQGADITALEMAANAALRDAQNAVGMTSVDVIDRESKSGIAQQELNKSQDISSYHFTDNFDIAIEYDGRVVNELLDKIEDSEREVGIRREDDTYEIVPLAPTMDESGQLAEHPYGDGNQHSVTISTGPSFESQREAAQETANQLLQNEAAFPLVGWLAIKMLNLGVYGDKMSDLLKMLMPPEARQIADEGDEPEIPPQAMQAIEAAKAEVEKIDAFAKQLQQQVIELLDEKQANAADLANKKEIAEMGEKVKLAIENMRREVEMAKIAADVRIAELQAATTLQKTHEELTTKEELADHAARTSSMEAERNREHEQMTRDTAE